MSQATMTTTSTTTSTNSGTSLAKDLRHMIDETDQFLKSAVASGDSAFDAVRDKFTEQLRQMQVQLDELEKAGVARARHAARVADQTVHAHPYGAMGIAAAAGLLVGFLAARR
jgi:ElaB/YqjD/DUF883 family membrane-anchored ribosome-binding protein